MSLYENGQELIVTQSDIGLYGHSVYFSDVHSCFRGMIRAKSIDGSEYHFFEENVISLTALIKNQKSSVPCFDLAEVLRENKRIKEPQQKITSP